MTLLTFGAYAATVTVMLVPITVWCVVSSAEVIAVRGAFLPGRPLGGDLTRLVRGRIAPAILGAPRSLPVVAALRLGASLALPFGNDLTVAVLLATILGSTAWLVTGTGGGDGADKIAIVACSSALLITIGRLVGDSWLCLAGLAWGAGQATIAYATSGIAKLARGFWRDGTALTAAMTSYRSGHAVAAAFVRHRSIALSMAWAVMLVEALFPAALFAPRAVCLVVLATLAAFHVATAFVMGLNTYPWAFVATYPCILTVNAIIGVTN